MHKGKSPGRLTNDAFLSGIKGVLKILSRTLDTDLSISVHPNFQIATSAT